MLAGIGDSSSRLTPETARIRMSNMRDRLDGHDGSHPSSWRPEPGSTIVGTILRYERADSAYGQKWVCVIEEEESGEPVSVWLLHTVLFGEFKKLSPKPGEAIGIKRLDDSAKGYARYTVILDRDDESMPDFGEAEGAPDAPPPDEDGATTIDPATRTGRQLPLSFESLPVK